MNKKKPNISDTPTFAEWLCKEKVSYSVLNMVHSDARKICHAWRDISSEYQCDILNMLPSLNSIGVSMESKEGTITIHPIKWEGMHGKDDKILMEFYIEREFLNRLKQLVDFMLSLEDEGVRFSPF